MLGGQDVAEHARGWGGVATAADADRVRRVNRHALDSNGRFVLYWMDANRRVGRNFALQRAVELANELGKPLVVVEALYLSNRWDSVRFHRFVLDGMVINYAQCAALGVRFIPLVEQRPGEAGEALRCLAKQAVCVVVDEYPCGDINARHQKWAGEISVRVESVDSNGLMPLKSVPKAFLTAYSFRCFLHKNLLKHLNAFPMEWPLDTLQVRDWHIELPNLGPVVPTLNALAGPYEKQLPIRQDVKEVGLVGGYSAARDRVERFVLRQLSAYTRLRREASVEGTSGLSGYLHFGHIGVHDVVCMLLAKAGWTLDQMGTVRTGSRSGWWGLSDAEEAYLDQIITWRELGFAMCHHRPEDHDQYSSLPEWAKETLASHRVDERPVLYSMDELERGDTHDELWNAAQTQLREHGWMHNYLRMLWGKRIVEWSPTPETALKRMVELNNRYALDGQDPNSYSGIFWVLGRFDRPWGPERPIFGKIRYMSTDRTYKKMDAAAYIRRYAGDDAVS